MKKKIISLLGVAFLLLNIGCPTIGLAEDNPVEVPIEVPAENPIENPLVPAAPTHELIINEIMAGTEAQPQRDCWIELYNTTDREILLRGWKMNGVTQDGGWFDVAEFDYSAIQPHSHFLVSHYTNSSSSALAVRPQYNNPAILFPSSEIHIVLQDPSGNLSDEAMVQVGERTEYRSFERVWPVSDGLLPENWVFSSVRVNLKEKYPNTYGTPFAPNSGVPMIGEASDFHYEFNGPALVLRWTNPSHEWFQGTRLYRILADESGWEFLAENSRDTSEFTVETFDFSRPAFKITTIDIFGRESEGVELTAAKQKTALINEAMPLPKTGPADNGFVELTNATDQAIDLRGWELDNSNLEDNISYLFNDESKDYTIPAGGFMAINGFELGFAIKSGGDTLSLYGADGSLADEASLTPIEAGKSWGRVKDNPENWIAYNHPTPAASNEDINHPPVPVITAQSDTGHMKLNVTGEGSSDPDGDSISYLWVFEPGITSSEKNPKAYSYSEAGEKTVTLTVTDEYGTSASAEYRFQAVPSGSGGSSRVAAEAVPAGRSYPKWSVIIESAIPNPEGPDEGRELLTLRNRLNEIIDLGGWKLTDARGGSRKFESITLFPQASKNINQSEFGVSLNNKSETLKLFDSAENLVDEMSWEEADSGQKITNFNYLGDEVSVPVVRVVDGDTFIIQADGKEIHVRLIGVDTPETVDPRKEVQPFGKEASDYLTGLITGKTASLKFDLNRSDKYGRLLVYLYLDGKFVNAEIIKGGYGRAYTYYPFQYLDEFSALEAAAKQKDVGIWANEKISQMIEETKPEEEDKKEEEKTGEEPKPEETNKIPDQVQDDITDHPTDQCLSDGLKIDTVLPNPKKGEGVEYIRLINTGSDKVCLDGWQLDDILVGGSKPFSTKGGSISAGAMRTFRKDETRIALNNSNDCAFLIDPAGAIADQICYGKTHAGETFTHQGGNYEPTLPKVKIKVAKAPSVKRDPLILSSTLQHQTAVGRIQKIDEGEEKIYLALDGGEIIPVAYAGSPVDMGMTKSLIDLGNPVIVDYRPGDTNQLLGLSQTAITSACPAHSNKKLYGLLSLAVLGNLFWLKRFKS